MSRAFIPAAFWRGGSSKGLFAHAADLSVDPGVRDAALLAALGSAAVPAHVLAVAERGAAA